MRAIEFQPKAWEEYQEWISIDRRTALRIGDLLRLTAREPFTGLGKPEPLKHEFKGFWSRRIDSEHRLIYEVEEHRIVVLVCRSHYGQK